MVEILDINPTDDIIITIQVPKNKLEVVREHLSNLTFDEPSEDDGLTSLEGE